MPEINHKDQPSIEQVAPKAATPNLAAALNKAGISPSDLEDQIKAILAKSKVEALSTASAKPTEPDWTKVTEADISNPAVFIPLIEHDIPDYMNIKLKDAEYEVVWASKDQRRVGQLLAEGYEYLRPEHIHPDFRLPLIFGSDKNYEYIDVVALRVHKRILYGKRRKALEISQRQLKNTNRPPKSRFTNDEDFSLDPGMNLYEAGV